jgi:hypothetical protein
VDGDAADPQLLGRAKDPHRDLTAICDEQLRDHDDMRVPRGAYESSRPGPAEHRSDRHGSGREKTRAAAPIRRSRT